MGSARSGDEAPQARKLHCKCPFRLVPDLICSAYASTNTERVHVNGLMFLVEYSTNLPSSGGIDIPSRRPMRDKTD
jgi:hypothetical protein